MTKVYVLEEGEYEQRGITGIFSTLENAQAAHPGNWYQCDDWHLATDTWVPGTTRWSIRGESRDIEAYDLDGKE